jgi:hypothetical protein
MSDGVEYEWECRATDGRTCGRKHKTEIKAKGCCANNDALLERELRSIVEYSDRIQHVEKNTRTPVRLRKRG